METINQISVEDLENLIEQKVIEILGDPDTTLELKEEFIEKLNFRLSNRLDRISHQEAIKRIG